MPSERAIFVLEILVGSDEGWSSPGFFFKEKKGGGADGINYRAECLAAVRGGVIMMEFAYG